MTRAETETAPRTPPENQMAVLAASGERRVWRRLLGIPPDETRIRLKLRKMQALTAPPVKTVYVSLANFPDLLQCLRLIDDRLIDRRLRREFN